MLNVMNKNKRNVVILSIVLVAIVVVVLFLTTTVTASNQNRQQCVKVKSIRIEAGDTLWEIASENFTEQCGTISEYVNQIKESNHLSNDTIHTGMYLIIPYYEENSSIGE